MTQTEVKSFVVAIARAFASVTFGLENLVLYTLIKDQNPPSHPALQNCAYWVVFFEKAPTIVVLIDTKDMSGSVTSLGSTSGDRNFTIEGNQVTLLPPEEEIDLPC